MEHVDVLVVGAGISGISAGWHLQSRCPDRTYAIFEGREALGGTWDLFRYPGVRSDSDMFTLGFAFRPWTEAKSIADGPAILNYLRETAKAYGIDRRIRLRHRVTRAAWDTQASRWTVDYLEGEAQSPRQIACDFLLLGAGYYNYAAGYRPHFPGEERFAGPMVHPQAWPEDLDYAGKQVVVIGSGATAVTLVPAMAGTAAKVTMLQRSPTYVVSRPAEDAFAQRVRKWLPAKLAYDVVRWRNVLLQMYFFNFARKQPRKVKQGIIALAAQQLGPDYDVATFRAIRSGKAEVVTDQIEAFAEGGITLKSGATLPADIIVTATGLDMRLMGGIELSVDGAPLNVAERFSYKAMMLSGVPNLATIFGYTNASWTLKADLTTDYVCRLLNHMRRHGFTECRPVNDQADLAAQPWLDFSSGYVARALGQLPKQGAKAPWRVYQNYALDLMALRWGALEDGVMRFSRPRRRSDPGESAFTHSSRTVLA
jgi:cation diffusion facilitator CzcD-associated flavoprotein CzcO